MTNGLVVMTPSSIAYSGTSASINADGSVVFSACSSLSLNGVFTSDYDNYMIVSRQTGSTFIDINYRMLLAGIDSNTGYTSQGLFVSSTSVTATRYSISYVSVTSSERRDGTTIYLFGPALAQPTALRSLNAYGRDGGRIVDYAATHSVSTAYDGLYLATSSGTMTGLVTVFGFNQ
jgi:hypothetical protein